MKYKIVSDYKNINIEKWSSFVRNHPEGNVFQTPEMFEVYVNTPKYEPIFIAIIDIKNQIQAILIAIIQKEHYGFLGIFSSRAIVFGAPLVKEDNPELLRICLKNYNAIIKKKAIYSQIRNFKITSVATKSVFKDCGYNFLDHLNIVLDLTIGIEKLWGNFSKSRRKGINKANKNNYLFRVSDELDSIPDFYELVSTTYERIRLPYPLEKHFNNIVSSFDKNNFKMFFIENENKKVAALFALTYHKTVYGYFMGSISCKDELKNKPLDLLFWEVFKWAFQNGYYYFDWLGAGKPKEDYGVRDFKLQFGGKTENFGRFQKNHKPILMLIGKIGFYIWRKIKK